MASREEKLKFLSGLKEVKTEASNADSRESKIDFIRSMQGNNQEPVENEYIEEMHPSLSSFGDDRDTLKNYLSSTGDVSAFKSKENPNIRFERDEDGRIWSYEEGSNKRYALDPSGLDLGDIGDIKYDALKTGGEIAGGIAGGALGALSSAGIAAPLGAWAGATSTGAALEGLRQRLGAERGIPNNTESVGTDMAIDAAFNTAIPVGGKFVGSALKSRLAKALGSGVKKAAVNTAAKGKEAAAKALHFSPTGEVDRMIKDESFLRKYIDDSLGGRRAMTNRNRKVGQDVIKTTSEYKQKVFKDELQPILESTNNVEVAGVRDSIVKGMREVSDFANGKGYAKKLNRILDKLDKSDRSGMAMQEIKEELGELARWEVKDLSKKSGADLAAIQEARNISDTIRTAIKEASGNPDRYELANDLYSEVANNVGKGGGNVKKLFEDGVKSKQTMKRAFTASGDKFEREQLAREMVEDAQQELGKNLDLEENFLRNQAQETLNPEIAGNRMNEQLANQVGDAMGLSTIPFLGSFFAAKAVNKAATKALGPQTTAEATMNRLLRARELRRMAQSGGAIDQATESSLRNAGNAVEKMFIPKDAIGKGNFSPYIRPDRMIFNFGDDE